MTGGDPKKQAKIVNVCGCLRGEWVGKNLHVSFPLFEHNFTVV